MKKVLGVLLALAIMHGILYAVLIPPWQAPDEIAHFEYSRLLVDYWRPLAPEDASPDLEREIIDSLYRFQAWAWIGQVAPKDRPTQWWQMPFFALSRTVGARFSMAYIPYALAVWPVVNADIVTQLYAMRAVSVLFGVGVVLLAFLTAQLIEPKSTGLAVGAALFLIFMPQHAFILATVNDGNLAELLASAAIYLLVKMLRFGITWSNAVACLGCVFASAFTKTTSYFLIPLTLVVGLALLRQKSVFSRHRHGEWKSAAILALLGAVFIFAVWDSAQAASIQRWLGSNLSNWGNLSYYLGNLTARGDLHFFSAVWNLFKSFWLTFGWMSLPLRNEAGYYLLLGLSILSLIGLVVRFFLRPRRSDSHPLYATIGLAALLPIAISMLLFVIFPENYPYQGRYVFGGIIAQALILTAGWLGLVPRHREHWAVWVMVSTLLLLDFVSIGLTIVAFYYHG
jgi:hypothetical protein